MFHLHIDIFGWRRVSELYEEGCRKDQKIRELEQSVRFKQVQHRGYGKELEILLKEKEELRAKIEALGEDRDEWVKKYKASEDARKSLGDKLVDAARENAKLQSALDVIRGKLQTGEAREGRIATEARAPARNDGEWGGAEA